MVHSIRKMHARDQKIFFKLTNFFNGENLHNILKREIIKVQVISSNIKIKMQLLSSQLNVVLPTTMVDRDVMC